MEKAWVRDESGRFEVRPPWKIDPDKLPNNGAQAIQRDMNLNRQISKNGEVKKLFTKQIQEMILNGILKEVDELYPKRYLPLLAVTDLERESTKVCVCLDVKTRHQNISMNDVLLKGRLEIPNILTIIMKYRTGEIVLIGIYKKCTGRLRYMRAIINIMVSYGTRKHLSLLTYVLERKQVLLLRKKV